MSQLMLINPRRKRRSAKKTRARSHKRRSRVVALRANPRRKHRRAARRVSRRSVMRMHRNPVFKRRSRRSGGGRVTFKGFATGTLIPSAIGAGGALGLDLVMGYVPLPAMLTTGMLRPVTRLAGAALIGWIASMVSSRQTAANVTAGAVTVVLYDTFKGWLKTAAPNLPLAGYPNIGWVNPGMSVGEYVGIPHSGGVVQPMNAGVGEYVGY